MGFRSGTRLNHPLHRPFSAHPACALPVLCPCHGVLLCACYVHRGVDTGPTPTDPSGQHLLESFMQQNDRYHHQPSKFPL